jgi:hypothetical protein
MISQLRGLLREDQHGKMMWLDHYSNKVSL